MSSIFLLTSSPRAESLSTTIAADLANKIAAQNAGSVVVRRDLAANVNWFSKVAVADDGSMEFVPGHSAPGAHVDLRFEMETLVLFHTCPHPLDPTPGYPRRPVRYQLFTAAPAADDDYCRTFRPENGRGFENNRIYHLSRG